MTPRTSQFAVMLLAVSLCLAPSLRAQQGSVATDKAALEALYAATDGANWEDRTNWSTAESLSAWFGVTTDGNGRVTGLDLRDNGLKGALPTDLENLARLESLQLDGNYALTGTLRSEIRNLSDLAAVGIERTELCVEDDSTLETWLEGVSFTGLVCPPTEQSVIDVAVFYTPAAREQAGGVDEIRASIDLATAEVNTAYEWSGVNQRIKLVAVREVTGYTEAGDDGSYFGRRTELARLVSPSDGYVDEVHAIRDAVAADIVVLVRSNWVRGGGVANRMDVPSTSFESRAFAVASIGWEFARVFAHELGHVMGLGHDRYVNCRSGQCNALKFPYAHGYVNPRALDTAAPRTARWHTLMAYPNQCIDAGIGCRWLFRYSNPEHDYPDPDGDPLGKAGLEPAPGVDGPADAARMLNRTRGYVASFRSRPEITVSFDAGQFVAAEGGAVATVSVRLSGAPGRAIDIPIAATGADGATVEDYAVVRRVAFAAGDTEQTVTVTAVDDSVDEGDETVTLSFGGVLPGGVSTGSPAMATVTLADDDTVTGTPSVLSVALTSDPAGGYGPHEEIEATVRFNKNVTVTGTPQLALTVGSTVRHASYRGGAGEALRFAYTVVGGENDTDGVSIAANSLALNGGTIRDSANQNVSLTHSALANDANHRVDSLKPALQSAAVYADVVTLTFSEALALNQEQRPNRDFWVYYGPRPFSPFRTREVTDTAVSGSTVTLTLDQPVPAGDVAVEYEDRSRIKSIRDLAGNRAASFFTSDVLNTTEEAFYDTDGDGLIEVATLAQLDAVRHDVNGDGVPTTAGAATYRKAFPAAFADPDARLRCGGRCLGYELTADLDFDTDDDGDVDSDDAYWNDGAGWLPIGSASSDRSFRAPFEGNGHTIRNLFINRPRKSIVGLFSGIIETSAIRRVGLTQVDVTGSRMVGGLVGQAMGPITASYATGHVSGTGDVGGLVGSTGFHATITGSYARVRVTGHEYVGGLVGTARNRFVTITASYATGHVSGGRDVGGLVGRGRNATITGSYATGHVSGTGDVGGLVGSFEGNTISNSYWDTATSGKETGTNGQGQTTAQLQAPTGNTGIYANWDDAQWDFGSSDDYPALAVDSDGDGDATWQELGYQLREGPALTATAGAQQVALNWTAVDTTHWSPSPAVTYTVTREGDTVETVAEGISDLALVDSGVTTGATYTYQVAAVVEGGEAARSELVTVTAVVGPALPEISITAGPSPVTEGTAATFTLTRTGPTTAELAVAVSVTESGAMLGANLPVSATFGVGDSSVTLTAATDNDDVVEASSAVTTTVTAGGGYAVGTEASASISVEDNDVAAFTVSAAPESIGEGASTALTVAISNGVTFAEAQTISIATSGTASASDYTGVPPTLTLAAGASSATATLAAATDQEEEEAETVTVAASHRGSEIGSATVTINSVSHDATLAGLSLSGIDIGTFSSTVTAYTASVGNSVTATTLTATAVHSGATVAIEPGAEVALAEGANVITVTVTAEDGTTTQTYTVTVTRASLPVATIAAGPTPVTEGTAATYTVTLDQAAPEALAVAVSVTESGSVLSGTPPASVSIAKGATSATLSVPTAGDSVVEADSTVTASVTAGTDYTIGTAATASVTVEDDDAATFTVSADPPTISEGESATLTVAIANGVTFAEEQTISLATSGTASAADYTGVAPTLTLAAGASSATATLVAAVDEAEEEAETVTVTASHDGSEIGSATVTINSVSHDATLSTLSLSGIDIGPFSGTETSYQASVANSVTATTVTATVAHSAATVAIEPGSQVTLAEGANEISVTVTAEDGTTTKAYTVTVTRAALPVATVTVGATPISEGTEATYTVSLDQAAPEALTVAVSVTESGSTLSGTPPASVAFAQGETSATLTVPTAADSVVEADSTVTAGLAAGTGYAVGSEALASVMVKDDDIATFTVSAEAEAISEGESTALTVAISNGVTFAEAQTISLATSGTASAADYTGVAPTLTLAAGASSATATLAAATDQEEEEAETVTVTASHDGSEIGSATVTINSVSRDATLSSLSLTGIDIGTFSSAVTAYEVSVGHAVETITVTAPASHAGARVTVTPGPEVRLAVGSNEIVITVTAEDGTTTQTYRVTVTRAALPVATIAAGPTSVTEGTAATYTVTLDQEAPELLAVAVSVTQSGSVLSGSPPASVSIAKGATSATLTVPTAGDSVVEADSTVTASVTAGTGYTIGTAATASVTVEDDDAATFTVLADPPTISEGGSATLTVAIANGVTFAEAQTISLATSGTASAADYTGVPPTLTLAAGASSATATLAAAVDEEEEEAETVTVTASYGGAPVGSATVTIHSVSRDATLSSLSLSGVDIGTFSGATTTYQASVENPVTATTVAATASHSGATVAIDPGAEVALAEGANRITVTVTAEDGTTTKTYTVTVTRASLPVVSIVAVEERPAGPVGVFRLSRTGPTTKPLEVQVLRASTRWPSDRLVPVRFPAGEASVTGRIQIGDNNLVEDDTTVTWTLQQGEGYTLSAERASASLVLAEQEVPEFAVSVEPAAIAEGESATFTVAITNGVRFAEAQTISLAASGTAGVADYTGLTATLKLAARESSATATLAAVADQEAEEVETLTLTASHGNSAIGSATVTIHSVSRDATLASLRLSGIDIGTFSGAVTAYRASVWHGVGTTTVTATASHPGATVTIDPGAEVSLVEGANEIRVTVTAEDGTTKTYTVTVTRAGPPVVSIVPVEERLTGPIGEFRLFRTGPTAEPLEVRVLFSSSRSSTGQPLTVRFRAGQASVTRRVQAGDNNLVEAEIAITWTLQQGEGYTLSAEHAAASLVLEESDVPEFAVAVEPAAVAADLLAELGVEPGDDLATIAADLLLRLGVEAGDDPARIAEGAAATLTVEITNGVRFAEAQTIAIEVAGGTASSGTDFTLSGQSLTLPRRAYSTTVTLQARNDDDDGEGDETVSVTARHAGQAIARQTLTIANRKLEAKFIKVPESHDGETAFVFELWLSKAARVSSAEEDSSDAVRWGKAFEELEGSLTKARRLAPGSDPPAEVADRRWELTVRPASGADIVLTLPVATDCSAEGALCTAGGSKHWKRVSVTVVGPGESEQAEEGFPLAPENSLPSGIWSDGETAWVADLDDARLYAYRRSDGERQPAQDIATGSVPMGLWADGDTIWVAGLEGGLRAHRLADGARVVDRDLALEANETPAGVWSDGETAWVSTWLGHWVHAYRLADGARVAGRDIQLSGENLMPVGVWSDGETLWVADWRERLYAYRLSDGRRVPQRDIEAGAGDTDPTGLWSGGGTLLSTGWGGREVRAYRLSADGHTPAAEDRATSRDAGEGSVPMIGDPVLGAAIREALGKGPGEAVSAADLAGLESLNVRNGGVRDLSGLEVLTGLTELDLGFNPLADPRQLASLPALESLNLDGSILDLGPLASLQGLRQLSVRHNLLDDLQPLAALTGLTELDIGDNRVEDLRPLGGLAGLTGLRADRNGIADLWPLASLTGLEALDLGANRIRDAQPLAGLEQLKVLRLDGNGLVELHPLAGLLGLADLGLAGNGVENLRAVAGMDSLRRLDLRGNAVGDLRPLRGLPSLVWVHVGGSRIGDLSPLDGVDGLTVAGREDREAPSRGHGGVRQQGGDEQASARE